VVKVVVNDYDVYLVQAQLSIEREKLTRLALGNGEAW
jgi:hypothetical protein